MKPMLSSEAPTNIIYPVWASYKLDGIRAVMDAGVALSRSLKPIPNRFVQIYLSMFPLQGVDGELTVGPENHPNVMQATMSGVMSEDGTPDFTYWVFDMWGFPKWPYEERIEFLRSRLDPLWTRIKILEQTLIHNDEELLAFEARALELGYEGIMIRKVGSLYKFGRSTAKEGYLLKLKRFSHDEAVIIGFEEQMHNANEATTSELGYTKRSSHKANMVPTGVMGALHVRDLVSGIEFHIGTGFDAAQREKFWNDREGLMGKIVRYKHFKIGVKEAPRFPVFDGFRDPIDL